MDARPRRLRCVVTILLVILGSGDVQAVHYGAKTLSLLMPNVQPRKPETYLCTAFKLPKHDYEFIVEFHPNATMQTAHHILIYGCVVPGRWQRDTPKLVWDCGEMSGSESGFERGPTCTKGSQIIYAWAKEAPPLKLPEGVGFKVGKGTGINYLVLQVHYAHVDKFLNGETDQSGIILTLRPSWSTSVTKKAGVYLLGTGGRILANSTAHMETACRIKEPVEMHPFAFRTHTHALGKVVSAFLVDGRGQWTMIGKHNPQEPQMFYPVEKKNLVIREGDIVAARCTMVNFRDRDTYVGSTAADEMCNFYMMYYVDRGDPMQEKYCFSPGPPNYYWQYDQMFDYVPKEEELQASTL